MEELNIHWDAKLKSKIDLMIKRVQDNSEQDNLLIIEGDTGVGKSNVALQVCYEVAKETGRELNLSNVFLDSNEGLDYAKKTREKIIIFDEPVYAGLKKEWWNKTQINLIKLLYTARVKRHFLVFNIVKFSEFAPAIIERAVAMIRVYQRDPSKKERRFLYFKQKNISKLLDDWKVKRKRLYNKNKSLRGSLPPYMLDKIINKIEYDKKKEDSILNIGENVNELKGSRQLLKLKFGIAQLVRDKHIIASDIERYLGIQSPAVSKWLKIGEKHEISLGNDAKMSQFPTLIINKGNSQEKNLEMVGEALEIPNINS